MKKLLLSFLFLLLCVPMAQAQTCPLTGPQIRSFNYNNYFGKNVWPSIVTVKGPHPFLPATALENLPMFCVINRDLTGMTLLDNGTIDQWNFTEGRSPDGCYTGTYVSKLVVDAPLQPSLCVADPVWAAVCGERGNETMEISVIDSLGYEAEAIAPAQATTRGSKAIFP